MKLKIKKLYNDTILPKYAHKGDAGMDCYAHIDNPVYIESHERVLIPLGFSIQLEEGYEAQIRPRSGLSLKQGLSLANCVGTVDENFTGEVCAIVLNISKDIITINPNDRICQMVINKYETANLEVVDELNETERGSNGFGSSGV